MRYDKEKSLIRIELGELVSIARRGISATYSDEEEPKRLGVGERTRKRLLGGSLSTTREMRFSLGGRELLLTAEIDGEEEGRVTLIRTLPHGGPIRKNGERQMRGEGFVILHMINSAEGNSDRALRLIVIDRVNGEESITEEIVSPRRAKALFDKCLGVLEKYAEPEIDRVTRRLPSLAALRFPYQRVRDGQDELLAATYRAACRGTTLYACAPTGTGKTVSVLFPALRALGEGKCDKVFYLTPKTTAGIAAAECLELLAEGGGIIRAILLSSKERSCKRGLTCRDDRRSCPTSGSDGAMPDAVMALFALERTVITIDDVNRVAEERGVCPYELELCYSELCDIIICDVNYLFDPRVYLRRFFDEGGRYFLLVDEAHNLAERAQEMYSAELKLSYLEGLLESPLIPTHSKLRDTLPDLISSLRELVSPYLKENVYKTEGEEISAAHESALPDELYGIIDALEEALESEYTLSLRARDGDSVPRRSYLREVYYLLRSFRQAAYSFDGGYRLFLFLEGGDIRIKLFAAGTAERISERVALCRGAVFFSATLSPLEYYRSVLGGDRSSEVLEVRSPFAPEQLSVAIVDKISTRYQERERTAASVVRAIAATIAPRRGNYMVFAPSYDYCELLSKTFSAKYPKIKTLTQRRDMTPVQREEFLASFREGAEEHLVGFCTLGGAYSEGVDLAGDRLIGAVVVGIGMPSPSYEREAMNEYYEDRFEAGKLYAYIYPGMNKVCQAAGRVIRREEDRGVITLIDDRFDDPVYKKIAPELWGNMCFIDTPADLKERISEFWRQVDEE